MIGIESDITATQLFERLKNIKIAVQGCQFSLKKCQEIVPLINKINNLKKTKQAVILAHSYVAPEIIYGVADYVGDSYKLGKNALESDSKIIVFAAVKFMGETAKIINPNKRVFIPSQNNGCTLADSIDEKTVKSLREQYPNHAFVCYINTTAAVKAYCDVCVTSSNVYDIVESFPNDKIYFLPDKLMGNNLIVEMKKRGVNKEILLYDGNCYVHNEYDPEVIDFIKLEYNDVEIIAHPECDSKVIEQSDFVGSTEQLVKHVANSKRKNFFVLTECGLVDRLKQEYPNKNYVGSCRLCRYMKSNSLEGILKVLTNPQLEDEVILSSDIINRARRSIDNMFKYNRS